jgi:hypothetical protein
MRLHSSCNMANERARRAAPQITIYDRFPGIEVLWAGVLPEKSRARDFQHKREFLQTGTPV